MADILPPRIEPVSDRNSGDQDPPEPRALTKAAAVGKTVKPRVPEVSAPEETDKHELDEMA